MKNIFNPFAGTLTPVLNKASEIKYIPTGDLVSTDVQAAITEVDLKIDNLPNPIIYKGTYNATTNTPALSNSDIDSEGFLYQVNVAGTVDFGAGPISFEAGDKVVNSGLQWEKWDMTDAVTSVNGQAGIVVLDTDDIAEGTTNLYYSDALASAAAPVQTVFGRQGTVIAANGDYTASQVTNVPSGNLAATNVQTALNELQSNIDLITPPIGDIPLTVFNAADNQSSVNVSGLVFNNATIRSFDALVSVYVDATLPLGEVFSIKGIQRVGDWELSYSSHGQDSDVIFDITSSGQIQYSSGSYTGFTSMKMEFRAITTRV